ncbi:MAG: hypothetical protein KA586_05590 [Candidatus Promineofilum sp.]|nr:hypothetical protein [Promineifilum sp.]
METGFPFVILIGPVIAATAALFARRWRRVTLVIGLVSVALLALLLALATPGSGLFADNAAAILGREIVMSAFVRSLLLLVYGALGILFLVVWARPAGRALVPTALAVLSPLAAALMVSPVGLGSVFLVAAAAAVVPALHGGKFDAVAPTWRYFLLVALSSAPILLTASGALTAPAATWLFPLLATLLLLGGFPFHIWVSGLSRHLSPVIAALVLGVAQLVVVAFLLGLLDTVPAARATIEFQMALRWSAALTALVGAFQMARATEWRRFVAGAVVLDMGFMPLVALSPGTDGLLIALPVLIGRFLALLLIALGLGEAHLGLAPTRTGQWVTRLRPVLLVYGCLSLLGLPLTPSFAGRWAQLAVAGQGGSVWPPLLLVVALAVGTVAAVSKIVSGRAAHLAAEPVTRPSSAGFDTGMMIFLVALAGLLGVFPDLLTRLAARVLGLG